MSCRWNLQRCLRALDRITRAWAKLSISISRFSSDSSSYEYSKTIIGTLDWTLIGTLKTTWWLSKARSSQFGSKRTSLWPILFSTCRTLTAKSRAMNCDLYFILFILFLFQFLCEAFFPNENAFENFLIKKVNLLSTSLNSLFKLAFIMGPTYVCDPMAMSGDRKIRR